MLLFTRTNLTRLHLGSSIVIGSELLLRLDHLSHLPVLPQLRSLEATVKDAHVLSALTVRLAQLQNLGIEIEDSIPVRDIVTHIAKSVQKCRDLEEFYVHSSVSSNGETNASILSQFLDVVGSGCKHLKKLELTAIGTLVTKCVCCCPSMLTTIRTFDLANSKDVLQALAKLPGVEKLIIPDLRCRMDIQEFASIPNICPNIRNLELGIHTHLVALRHVESNRFFSNLEDLTVESLSKSHLTLEKTDVEALAHRLATDLGHVRIDR